MPPLSRRSIRTSTPRRRAVRHRRLPGANARARRQPLRNLQEAGSLTDGQFTVFGNVELVRRREVLRRKPQVHDWDEDERQHQRAEYAADDDDAEAGTDAGTRLEREGEREVSRDDRDAGHHDRTETGERALLDRVELGAAALAQRIGVVDKQDPVLARDPDQQDRSDERERRPRRGRRT